MSGCHITRVSPHLSFAPLNAPEYRGSIDFQELKKPQAALV